jgi:phage-related protein
MFNRTQLNLTKFNISQNAYAYILMQGTGTISATGAINVYGDVLMQGVGSVYAAGVVEVLGQVLLEGRGSVYADGLLYEVKAITFTGTFPAGSKITIDMDKYTAIMDGENALSYITGDFFNLNTGENDIVYTDGSTNRTVYLTVEHRDRWL